MKATKYIVMVISMVCVLGVNAQPQTEQPQVQFQSTSAMQASGSSLASQPMLNEDGTAYNPAAAAAPAKAPGGPRKSFGNNQDAGYKDPGSPIGDALIPLALMALIYGFFVYRRKRSI